MNEKDLYNNSNFDYDKLDDNTNPNSSKFNEKETELPLLLENENK
jgi:hypothetical protein